MIQMEDGLSTLNYPWFRKKSTPTIKKKTVGADRTTPGTLDTNRLQTEYAILEPCQHIKID
jgi:hypothetical protein